MSGKIMVVDDNAATRRMVRNALVRNGHDVIEAADGRTALELMRTEHPRVVLQDLALPDTDGYELVGELRRLAHGTDVSILAFSGFVSGQSRHGAAGRRRARRDRQAAARPVRRAQGRADRRRPGARDRARPQDLLARR
jgi:CheY-like chemotaxis protein